MFVPTLADINKEVIVILALIIGFESFSLSATLPRASMGYA